MERIPCFSGTGQTQVLGAPRSSLLSSIASWGRAAVPPASFPCLLRPFRKQPCPEALDTFWLLLCTLGILALVGELECSIPDSVFNLPPSQQNMNKCPHVHTDFKKTKEWRLSNCVFVGYGGGTIMRFFIKKEIYLGSGFCRLLGGVHPRTEPASGGGTDTASVCGEHRLSTQAWKSAPCF